MHISKVWLLVLVFVQFSSTFIALIFLNRILCKHCISLSGEALIPVDAGILDNYRVKKQLLHSW